MKQFHLLRHFLLLAVLSKALLFSDGFSAIYGEDERELISQSKNENFRLWARSVAAQLRYYPTKHDSDYSKLITKKLENHVAGLCSDQLFAQEKTFSRCTAFLVGEDLLLTAGHCVNDQRECEKRVWAFTSEIKRHKGELLVKTQDLYTCKKFLAHKKNPLSQNDYSLIKLNRKVIGRPFLKYRKEGRVAGDAELAVIGHPTGLPLIVTDRGRILKNESDFIFTISSDTFAGNSGSPVINRTTGLVEGMLINGELDYILNKKRGCLETYKCEETDCQKGEQVLRITVIPKLVPNMTPLEPLYDLKKPRL